MCFKFIKKYIKYVFQVYQKMYFLQMAHKGTNNI